MALTQTHLRFRTDGNAVDATPTWGADEDASPSPAATPFRLRIGVKATSAASGEFELYAQKNAGSYAAVTTSATGGVQSYDASSDADDTILRTPRLTLSAAWWLAGATIDLDFANNQIYPSGAFTDYLSCTRSSDGYAKNSAGDWVQFSSNVLRRTDLGLLSEDARTNYLLQSGTPATQTTESLSTGDYTLWVEGSGSALASGGTATITGASSATDGSPDVFTVTIAGTVTVTVTGTLDRFQLENGLFASSYIPTTTTSAARAMDDVRFIGSLNNVANATSASIVEDFQSTLTSAITGSRMIIGEVNGAGGSSTTLLAYNANANAIYVFNPSELDVTIGNSLTVVGGVKIGVSWDGSGRSAVAGGGTVASDASPVVPKTWAIGGSNQLAGISQFGYHRRLTAWDSRLADATLQGHTAP